MNRARNPGRLAWLAVAAAALLAALGSLFLFIRSFAPPAKPIVIAAPPSPSPDATKTAVTRIFGGTVIDAQTRRPVADFQARIGRASSRTPGLLIFRDQPAMQFHDGTYQLKGGSLESTVTQYVRIEALGYLPGISSPLKDSATADFELQPAANIQGVVLTGRDQPVAGARVILGLPGMEVYVHPDEAETSNNQIETLSGADGRFVLPPQSGPFGLVVLSDQGVARFDRATPAEISRIHLAAWGRIEGTLTLSGRAADGAGVSWEPPLPLNPAAVVTFDEYMKTDSAGRFHFDRVPPGTVQVQRLAHEFPMGMRQISLFTHIHPLTIAAGQTATINLGRNGRPVSGRLAISKAINIPTTAMISGSALPGGWSDPTTRYSELYPMEIDEVGRFDISDVPAGRYTVQVMMKTNINGKVFATGSEEFVVPPIDENTSGQPLEIPDITIVRQP